MSSLRRRTVRIRGIEVPRRRFTARAVLYFAAFVCLPIIAVAAVLDYLVYVLLIR